ncbi:YifB family Mg chelatase-like AAA ATPase [Rickettsiales bacterium]|nr:YifB family Mg chelatase-like AAA ATPase [Rickettsiales bacterium]MDA7705352.1 YifB family Mg chelatase-like AAA ATPase [Rickettsiales bacterium]MDB2550391.1 YifB family Mg chelatase-like AAA ATPase [Rickettsiales bacterium]
MVATVKTFTFIGIKAIPVDVEVKIASGTQQIFNIVGLPDKALAESRERVRAAINSIGLNIPPQRITVNLAPADLEKEGSHFDLPITLGLLAEMNIIDKSQLQNYYCLGELSLNGKIKAVNGILSAAITANEFESNLICPEKSGPEAIYASDDIDILAPDNLLQLINHFKGTQILSRPEANFNQKKPIYPCMSEVKGQKRAKRALEIAASGGHNMLMIGPPGSGKSMIASRLTGILPELTIEEMLEVNMINSISGNISNGQLITNRPFRAPHHSCSMPAMVGGGMKTKPGEISLAHNGVLFLDELGEFPRQVLDSLRQPIEDNIVTISRANSHITYPANFQLIAAMNPCRCGYLGNENKSCNRAPQCGKDYQAKISGPILDRMDIVINVPQINIFNHNDYDQEEEDSLNIIKRVKNAQNIQYQRSGKLNSNNSSKEIEKTFDFTGKNRNLIEKAMKKMDISMRGFSRILKVSRTIADLENSKKIEENHLSEAIAYRSNI